MPRIVPFLRDIYFFIGRCQSRFLPGCQPVGGLGGGMGWAVDFMASLINSPCLYRPRSHLCKNRSENAENQRKIHWFPKKIVNNVEQKATKLNTIYKKKMEYVLYKNFPRTYIFVCVKCPFYEWFFRTKTSQQEINLSNTKLSQKYPWLFHCVWKCTDVLSHNK